MAEAPAGWYPQGDATLRYWDGAAWINTLPRIPLLQERRGSPGPLSQGLRAVLSTDVPSDPEAIWQAVGKPLTGVGAGRYKLTRHYLFFEKGIVSTNGQQVPVSAVIDVDVKQNLAQKARGLGTLAVHVQRMRGVEIVHLEDIEDFRRVQMLINQTAHAARLSIQKNNNTHRYENTHLVGHLGALGSAGRSRTRTTGEGTADCGRPDGATQGAARLPEEGVLTEEEFAAKKSEILSRI